MNTEHRRRRLTVWAFLGLSAGVLLTGCGLVDTEDPTTARLVLGGAAGHPLELIISDDFDVLLDDETQERILDISSADTLEVSAPFDTRYDLGSRARFYARLDSETTPPTLVSMRVFVGGEVRYNRQTNFDGEYLEFIFTVK